MPKKALLVAVAGVAVVVLPFATLPAGCINLTLTEGIDAGSGGSGGGGLSPDAASYFNDGGASVVTDGGPPPDAGKVACLDMSYADPWTPGNTISPSVTAEAQKLTSKMSISDLAVQMRGTSPGQDNNYSDIFRTMDDTNNGIRGFKFRDGPRGACLAAQLPSGDLGYSTAFPVPETRAASFDLALEEQIGEAIGDEVLASGNTMVLAPVINILRHPAWGRAQETYGEDSYLLGRMGSAFTTGAQMYIPACAKHFAAYNIEDGRESNNSGLDEQTLREHYTRHFGVVIEDSGVSCIMASYNLTNGTHSAINHHLLTDILVNDFNFQGIVLSDWWAMPPGTASTTTDALQAGAIAGVNAGLDMELPWAYNYGQLQAVTGTGEPLSQSQLTADATRILTQKFRFGVESLSGSIGIKSPTTSLDATGSITNNAAHVALAEQAAIEGTVLLKNENNTLPIPSTVHTIAVIGASVPYAVSNTDTAVGTIDFATNVRLGDLGSSRVFSDPAKSSGPFAGIQANAPVGVTVVSGNSVSAAANADFIVAVAGLTPQDEGEEYTGAGDRPNFALDGKAKSPVQDPLIMQLIALNKPMVVVLEGGAVIDMPWLSQVHAVVMAWYPGMAGGAALGQLLFGKVSFSGKLPMTWPVQWNDEPAFNTGATTQMGYYVGYQYFDENKVAPLYAFGHGLSYTTFSYNYLQVPCNTVTANGVVAVTATVMNTGAVAGDETAFLFVSYPGATERRPIKELKSFARVSLEPGQSKIVTLPVRVSDLKYWNTTSNAWQAASGPVKVMVGPSSDNLPLEDTFTVQ
jgi:beta-glucosidase